MFHSFCSILFLSFDFVWFVFVCCFYISYTHIHNYQHNYYHLFVPIVFVIYSLRSCFLSFLVFFFFFFLHKHGSTHSCLFYSFFSCCLLHIIIHFHPSTFHSVSRTIFLAAFLRVCVCGRVQFSFVFFFCFHNCYWI